MKLKNYCKRFFTWNRHASAGFTLVELIVVIAILAILAGVAIPVYSGYIKKANRAADEQLLGTINTAFATACAAKGINPRELTGNIYVNVNADGSVGAASRAVTKNYFEGLGDLDAAVEESFAVFYAGNENAVFKTVTANLPFDPETGLFGLPNEDGSVTVTVNFGGKTHNVNQSSVDAFKAATVFSDNVESLQGQVDSLAGAFSDLVGDDVDGFAGNFGEDYAAFVKGLPAEQLGNATVLYVASKSAGLTPDEIANRFLDYSVDINTNDNLLDAMVKSDDMLTDSAMMYGALVAYVNSGYYNSTTNPDFKDKVENVNSALGLLEVFQMASQDNSFMSYVGQVNDSGKVDASTQFTTDMNGFLGALDVIDTVSGGVDKSQDDVWSSDEVDELLGTLLGSK